MVVARVAAAVRAVPCLGGGPTMSGPSSDRRYNLTKASMSRNAIFQQSERR